MARYRRAFDAPQVEAKCQHGHMLPRFPGRFQIVGVRQRAVRGKRGSRIPRTGDGARQALAKMAR